MATEYTPNYNLDLYASADKPNLRDQYNAAMGKIDTQLKTGSDNLVAANNNISTLQTQMGTANESISTLQTQMGTANEGISKNATDIAAVRTTAESALSLAQTNESDIASTETDVTNLETRVTAVEGKASANETDIAELQTTVSQHTTEINGKAPIDHSSATTEYGIGSATEYGHVKLVDEPGTSTAANGVAVTPAAVNFEALLVDSETMTWTSAWKPTVNVVLAEVGAFAILCLSVPQESVQWPTAMTDSQYLTYVLPENLRPTRDLRIVIGVIVGQGGSASINAVIGTDGRILISVSSQLPSSQSLNSGGNGVVLLGAISA